MSARGRGKASPIVFSYGSFTTVASRERNLKQECPNQSISIPPPSRSKRWRDERQPASPRRDYMRIEGARQCEWKKGKAEGGSIRRGRRRSGRTRRGA